MAKVKKLTPGSVASIYRQGGGTGDCLGQHVVPADGTSLRVRDLAPGVYEARDSTGREASFEVKAGDEDVVVATLYADPEPEPDSSPNPNPDEAPRLHGGRSPASPLPHMPDAGELEPDLNPPAE